MKSLTERLEFFALVLKQRRSDKDSKLVNEAIDRINELESNASMRKTPMVEIPSPEPQLPKSPDDIYHETDGLD